MSKIDLRSLFDRPLIANSNAPADKPVAKPPASPPPARATPPVRATPRGAPQRMNRALRPRRRS